MVLHEKKVWKTQAAKYVQELKVMQRICLKCITSLETCSTLGDSINSGCPHSHSKYDCLRFKLLCKPLP